MKTYDVYTRWDGKSTEAIRHEQGRLLHTLLKKHVLPFSKQYREVFKAHGLTADDIQSVEDLQKIPFTTKLDLLNTPEQPKRIRDYVLIPDEKILKKRPEVILKALTRGKAAVKRDLEFEYRPVFMISTTGRSADSVPFLLTRYDLANLERAGYALCDVFAAGKDHKILNMFPYAPHLGFWQVHYACMNYNAFGLSTGGGKVMGTDRTLGIMDRIQPEAIVGMPTFLYHLLQKAVSEGHRFESIDAVILGGEKVPDGMRRKLAELCAELGSPKARVMACYGFTEARMAWGECAPNTGYHITPDLAYIEIIDPETGQVVPDGQPGEIVFTALDGRGAVVLRYRTGDFIDGGLVYGECPDCGRNVPRLMGKIGRESEVREMHFDKVKGTLVDFNTLEHLLDDETEIGTWQIELRKMNDDPLDLDELVLHIQKNEGTDVEPLSDRLNLKFEQATSMRPNRIEFHTIEDLSRMQGLGVEMKEQRLVDHRPKAVEEKS
ncbi:MAG: phenylacetate-CoA ligase [Kiritimatiellia bacterium]|jgi:phenylacetate-CoA ligase